ncbi:MAG: M28 family peptidase [Nannocystaceae bacterium]|nr:M28 family peptidase [Deltaproteobacteria bacterium]MBP7289672.1 M28 family peptidase [Nannocystaceae bacterium]
MTGGSETSATASTSSADSTGDANPCNDSPEALAGCVDADAWADDLAFVAAPRVPGAPHWQEVQDLCADRLTALGYETVRYDYGSGVDVIGRRVGATAPNEVVLIGAHYDHIADCDGADDNASGVAAALEIARILAMGQFDRTTMIACWDEEETGLDGSVAFVDAAAGGSDEFVMYFNFDGIGYRSTAENSQTVPTGFDLVFAEQYANLMTNGFKGDFIALIANSTAHDAAQALYEQATGLGVTAVVLEIPAGAETSDLFADLRRSDHAAFWDGGLPAVFATDTANFRNPHYHCMGGPDDVVDIDQAFAVGVTAATAAAAAISLGLH